MKVQLVFTIAACLLASSAFAQGPGKVKAQSNTTAIKLPPQQQSPAADQAADPSNGNGESTAALSANVPEKKAPFGLAVSFRTDADASKMNLPNPKAGEGPAALGITRVTGTFNLTESRSISVRQEFQYTFEVAASPTANRGVMNDAFIGYTDSKLLALPGDWNLGLTYRQYLPDGEQSRFVTKRMGMEYLWATVDKSIGKFDLTYHLIPYIANNTQDYYLVDGAPKANFDYEIDQFMEVDYNITPKLQFNQYVGSYNIWNRPTPAAGVTRINQIYLESGFTFKPVKQVTLSASVENDATMRSDNDFKLLKDTELTYRALMILSL